MIRKLLISGGNIQFAGGTPPFFTYILYIKNLLYTGSYFQLPENYILKIANMITTTRNFLRAEKTWRIKQ